MVLELKNVSKVYNRKTTALNNISIKVNPGDFIVVLGKSGSGKSTLMRCINRLVEPTSGQIFFEGIDLTRAGSKLLRRLRRDIGMVFQNFNLIPRASVLTNVLSGRLGYCSPWGVLLNHFSKEDRENAFEKLEQLEISDKAFARADCLSGGQQQRVGIARALLQKPKLILADEPISALDPATSRTILNILKRINEVEGITIICNLHLPDLALQYGNRLIALKSGKLAYNGPPDEISEERLLKFYASD